MMDLSLLVSLLSIAFAALCFSWLWRWAELGWNSSNPSSTNAKDEHAKPRLYFYAQGNLRNPSFLPKLISWMDLARGCGYHGMFYADNDIQKLHIPGSSNSTFKDALGAVLHHAQKIGLELMPLIFPFGPSDPIFSQPGWGHTLAEPLAFRGALFKVDANAKTLVHVNEYAGLVNGDFTQFEGDSFSGWQQDKPGIRTFADMSGCYSRGSCLRIGPGNGDGLVMQQLSDVAPFTQLHVTFFARSEGFSAVQYNVEIRCLLPPSSRRAGSVRVRMGRRLSWWSLNLQPTQMWQKFEYIASSWDGLCPIGLFLGVEDRGNITGHPGQAGNLWFDDVSVTTTALINVLRRDGAPLRIYDATSGEAYEEGRDVETVLDPLLYAGGHFDTIHAAPNVRVSAAGSRLKPGQRVRIDYYAVNPVFGSGVASCLLHEGIFQYMTQNARVLSRTYNWSGFLLSYDEMRQVHNDAQETESFTTAGQLLAWHMRNATSTVRKESPKAKLYVWDDMFNPYHNAGSHGTASDGYFLVNGSLEGSWLGLDPSTVSVLNWGPCNDSSPTAPGVPPCRYRQGLDFFAQRGLNQVIGGYYDYGNGTAAAEREFHFARGIPHIEGYSYTTWGSNNPDNQPDYDQMCAYAESLRHLHAQDVIRQV